MAGEETTRSPVSNSHSLVPTFLVYRLVCGSGPPGKTGLAGDGVDGQGLLVLILGDGSSSSFSIAPTIFVGSLLSLRKKNQPPAAASPPRTNNPAIIAITRGALLFDWDADGADKEGPAEAVGETAFEDGAAGSGCAAMTSESGVQSLNPS